MSRMSGYYSELPSLDYGYGGSELEERAQLRLDELEHVRGALREAFQRYTGNGKTWRDLLNAMLSFHLLCQAYNRDREHAWLSTNPEKVERLKAMFPAVPL